MSSIPEARRILFAVRHLSGHEGISTHIKILAKGLLSRGWKVGIVSSTTALRTEGLDLFDWMEKLGIPRFYVPFPKKRFTRESVSNALQALPQLARVYREFDPDIIHVFSPFSLSIYMYMMRLITGEPYVSSCRVSPQLDRGEVKFAKVAMRLSEKYLGDHVIAISSKILDEYHSDLHVPPKAASLVLNGIDGERFHPPSPLQRAEARRRFDITSDDEHVFCHVGRLGYTKGHDVTIRALTQLRSRGMNVKAIFAGSGDREEEIKRAVRKNNLNDMVNFPGFVDPLPVYWASDITVLPSIREGFANAVAEAMHCGVVPIRTPTAGASDQISHGKTGYIIPFNDDEALADRIQLLFRNKMQLRAMSRNASSLAQKKFSAESMLENMVGVYNTVLEA